MKLPRIFSLIVVVSLSASAVLAQAPAVPVPFSAPPAEAKIAAALPAIIVQGNRFVNPAGETFIFRGLALSDPAALLERGQWSRRYFEEAKNWHANVYVSRFTRPPGANSARRPT